MNPKIDAWEYLLRLLSWFSILARLRGLVNHMAFFEKICQCHLHHGMLANYDGKVGDISADGSVFRLWLNFEDNLLGQRFEVMLHFGVIREKLLIAA